MTTCCLPLELLTVHPLLVPLPPLAMDAPEMTALIEGIELHGFLRPVVVNDRNEIMDDDGRCVVRAALKAGRKTIPCVVAPDEDAASIILSSLCGCRHLSKSALAYLAFPLLEAAAAARQAARIRGLKAGSKSRSFLQGTNGKISVEEVAHQYGFARSHYYRAREVHALFAEQPAYKAQMEPRLLSSDENLQVSLQGVLAGWTGKQNEGQPRRIADQLDLFDDAFGRLRYHFKRSWASMDAESRAALAPRVRETVADMPPEVRALFVTAIKEVNKAAASQPV